MTKVTVFEYDIGNDYEAQVFSDFQFAVDYAKTMMKWEGPLTIDQVLPHTSRDGMRVQHIDTEVGESVVYETLLIEPPPVKPKKINKSTKSLKRKVNIS